MNARLAAAPPAIARTTFTLACTVTAAYAFAYLYLAYQGGNPFAERFAASGLDVPAHFFGAGLALLLAPLQISVSARRRWPALHRVSGWLYALAILFGGIGGLSLAQHAQGGLPTAIGFSVLSLLWLAVTWTGVCLAVTGDTARHRTWMAYSVALTSAAVTLRLMLAVAGLLHVSPIAAYIAAAWASWLLNLAICALLLRGAAGRRSAFRPRSA